MKFKTIVIIALSAVTAIILYKNTEKSSFWLFGDIEISKLVLLSIFYFLGIITGGILFRRKSKHPKEYTINNSNNLEESNTQTQPQAGLNPYSTSNLSDEDRAFLSKD